MSNTLVKQIEGLWKSGIFNPIKDIKSDRSTQIDNDVLTLKQKIREDTATYNEKLDGYEIFAQSMESQIYRESR